MAIEPLKHVSLLVPRKDVAELTDWLQKRSVIHVEDAACRIQDEDLSGVDFEKPALPTEEVDNRIRQLRHILDVYKHFDALESSFIEMIVALPRRVTIEERKEVLSQFEYKPLYDKICRLEDEAARYQSAAADAREEYEQLEFFRLLPFEPEDIHSLKRVKVWVGSVMEDKWDDLLSAGESGEFMALTELRRRKKIVDICAVALEENAEEAARLLRGVQFDELSVPEYDGTRRARMDHLLREIDRSNRELKRCGEEVHELADRSREVEILLGHWEAERAKIRAQNCTLNSRRISLLTGFIRERDIKGFQKDLAEHFPSVSDIYNRPGPDDEVPVEITNKPVLKPLRFLVDLFGRPDYYSFDPTPYLALSFLIFFGMCFGDVVYGFALAVIGYLLARKAKPYEGLHNLCMLFCYAGVFTMVIGVLMGSWASDLWHPDYLGENNFLYRIQQRTAVVDPIERALLLLVVSIGIGVLNQFYGIILKAYGLMRKGKWLDAVFDAGLWFLVLPGFLIAFSSLFFDIPSGVFTVGVAMMILGGVGLVLTQGRDAESIPARLGAGLISIYGIMGSYGCVTFLSDILSYSRLIALGLTTTIVGMAFNIIADLVRGAPVVGVVLFVLVLIVGHTFNFMVSMLAAFVHPARLIFLEFFNRFYETGGPGFEPLSLSTDYMIVETGEQME